MSQPQLIPAGSWHLFRGVVFGQMEAGGGTKVSARYIDLVSNGDMSLYIANCDATQDEMTIEQHSFT